MNSKVKTPLKPGSAGSAKAKASAESRQRIIDAAVRLFAQHGFAATGLRELAAAADVNLAMINYFFGSKKGLLKEILDDFFAGYVEVAQQQLLCEGETAHKVETFIKAAVHYFAQRRDYVVVVISELPHDDPEVLEHKASWGRQMVAILGQEICQPLLADRGQTLSPMLIGPMLTSMMASRFLFAPISEKVMTDEHTAAPSIDEYAEQLSRIFLSGVLG
jgi:AcrR family transcriptional regulator